jgi:hypothetical protein
MANITAVDGSMLMPTSPAIQAYDICHGFYNFALIALIFVNISNVYNFLLQVVRG